MIADEQQSLSLIHIYVYKRQVHNPARCLAHPKKYSSGSPITTEREGYLMKNTSYSGELP